jgi:O-methyltransferase involved in polyketide biosynthesis
MDSARKSATISPTAHYTAQVWLRNDLSDERLRTPQGDVLWHLLAPVMAASRRAGGPTLEDFLLARHQIIDLRLAEAIDAGRVAQVIEIAAGLSSRGLRFTRRYGASLTYVEADLPGMAARKQRLLGRTAPNHRVAAVDALADTGPDSLAALARSLDPSQGVAILTEGLLNYFDRDSVLGMWGRFARVLAGFPHGLYLADIHVRDTNHGLLTGAFRLMLSTFVRSRVHFHFATEQDVAGALIDGGFVTGAALDPRDFSTQVEACGRKWAKLVRVIEATTSSSRPP